MNDLINSYGSNSMKVTIKFKKPENLYSQAFFMVRKFLRFSSNFENINI